MARILITSGPTRQYLDPVRYLTNASSGRMGCALAAAALKAGHEVWVISGPVEIEYPDAAQVTWIISTEELLEACQEWFPKCDGVIGVAAPCDYRPIRVSPQKITKTGGPLILELIETPDVMAELAGLRGSQWMVAFALETEDHRLRALQKLERKKCDLIVSNSAAAIHAVDTSVEILAADGRVLATLAGPKDEVAVGVIRTIQAELIDRAPEPPDG